MDSDAEGRSGTVVLLTRSQGDLVQGVGWVVLFPAGTEWMRGDLEAPEPHPCAPPRLGHVLSLHSAAGIMLWEAL